MGVLYPLRITDNPAQNLQPQQHTAASSPPTSYSEREVAVPTVDILRIKGTHSPTVPPPIEANSS